MVDGCSNLHIARIECAAPRVSVLLSPNPTPTGSNSLNDHATISRFPNLLRAALTINFMPWVLPVSFQRLLTIHLTSFDLFNPPYAIHAYLSLLFGQSTIIHNNYPCHDPFFLCSLFIVSRYITAQPYTLTHKGRFINTIASYTPLISKYPSPLLFPPPVARFALLCFASLLC